jgi:hypothetical protein
VVRGRSMLNEIAMGALPQCMSPKVALFRHASVVRQCPFKVGLTGSRGARPLEITVGVPFTTEAGLVDRDVVADAGDDVLQDPSGRLVKQNVVRATVATR